MSDAKRPKKVLDIRAYRKKLRPEEEDSGYQKKIETMDKMALLDEMVLFQEQRSKVGKLTLKMMIRGKILFRALETKSETEALRSLTRAYRRHLDYELNDYLKNQSNSD